MRTLALATLASVSLVSLAARPADAFCGFYVGGAGQKLLNGATEVVLMRHGTTTVLSMENNYQGPPDKFAMVVPVPVVVKESQVKTLPHDVFEKIDTLGAPRLVEYWEQDPCAPPPREYEGRIEEEDDADAAEVRRPSRDEKEYHVKIEAQFSVGEYDIVVLSAQESTGLQRWLTANKYEIPRDAEPLLRPYVEQGMKFFVAKVDTKKVMFHDGMATLSPLRFYYDSPEFSLPIRLGTASSPGTQDLIVNILAPNNTRYETANRPNLTIPTNLVVTDAVRTRFGEFYAALFDHALADVPNAVVTEYAWDTGSCDPCPGPVLDGNDLATFGADVLDRSYQGVTASGFTLTRLHARYGKDIKDDLVFRAVEPIEGGRGVPAADGAMPLGAQHTGSNNFQGRYVILHPWTGAAACAQPRRGTWGGPPNEQQIAAQAATNLAFAPRGKVELGSMLASGAVPQANALGSKTTSLPLPIRKPEGCACNAADQTAGALGGLGVFAAVGLVARRRRRR